MVIELNVVTICGARVYRLIELVCIADGDDEQ
jgi:hypothetical protein